MLRFGIHLALLSFATFTLQPGTLVSAAIASSFSDIQNVKFDFIVVGGGIGGSVVASRLTENPDFNVLVLEAGSSDEGVLNAQVPFFAPNLQNTQYDWNYTTVQQPALRNRELVYPRGRMLGGTSSTNFLIYTRGASDQHDDYARISEDPGWSWKNLQKYLNKNEKWTEPADHHDTRGQYDPRAHSTSGVTAVSVQGNPTEIDGMIIGAAKELKGPYSYNLDYSAGNPLGVGWVQTTIDGAFRASASTSYLTSEVRQRKNLYILLNTQASKLIQTSGSKTPAFRAVEFRQSVGGPIFRATASKEVIMSAGTVGSAHILLNSGIGNSTSLKAVGVQPIVDLPEVGQNYADHPAIPNPWLVKGNQTFEEFTATDVLQSAFQQWQNNGTGPLVNTVVSHLGFFRSELRPGSSNTPDYEFLFANGRIIPNPLTPPNGHFLTVVTGLMTPKSKGSVQLRSNNPFDAPLIDPAFLKEEEDKLMMKEAVKSALKFVSAKAWSNYVISPSGGLQNTDTDAGMEEYIGKNVGTFFHPTSSLRMSAKGATTGVVDPDLKVKKIDGVRVVDASVFPNNFGGHPQAAIYAYAERASDFIKQAYSH